MTRTALVIAAHGSRHEPAVNAGIRALADAVAARGLFDEVAVAFHQGRPLFSTVLDDLRAEQVTVVPLMSSDGYYSDVVLPRELARNQSLSAAGRMVLRQTEPVGTHPQMAALIAERVGRIMAAHGLSPQETTVAVVGHGTPRHARSCNSTIALADRLRRLGVAEHVLAAFLDEEPFVESIVPQAREPAIIVVPFLIAAGAHATGDVPRRVGLALAKGQALPASGFVDGRFIVCDAPFGDDPAIIEIILDLARPPRFASSQEEAKGGSQARRLRIGARSIHHRERERAGFGECP